MYMPTESVVNSFTFVNKPIAFTKATFASQPLTIFWP